LKEALQPVFATPLPWDEYEDYNMKTIEVYFEAD
jgi:hypothetical protein